MQMTVWLHLFSDRRPALHFVAIDSAMRHKDPE